MRWANMKLSLAQLDASKVHLQKGPSRLLLDRLCASEQNVCFLWFGFVCKLLYNFLSLLKSNTSDIPIFNLNCRTYICCLLLALTDLNVLKKGILFPIFVSPATFSINPRHDWAVLPSVQGMVRDRTKLLLWFGPSTFWNTTVKVYHHFHACHVVCLGFKANIFLKRAMIKKDRCLDQCPVLERTLCVHYQFQSCFMLIEVLNDPKHIQHL
jgi:hypothetical protein